MSISRVAIAMAAQQETVDDVPCGNIVCLGGIDRYITKTATLVADGEADCHPLKDMKYSVSPVVRVAVEVANSQNLPKLIDGMGKLKKSCQLVQCTIDEETKEYIIAAAGELHLEICIKDLQPFMKGEEIRISPPSVSLRETVTEKSGICLAKSANKHNRIWATMEPLSEELCQAIESGEIGATMDPKQRTRILVDKLGWKKEHANKIWAFGPDAVGPNVVVDATKGVQGVQEVKNSITSAWQEFTNRGVLCGEQVRGLRLNITDLTFHSDAVHRGANQIVPMAKRCFKACQLSAKPRILEPVFLTEISAPETEMGRVYGFLNRKRSVVIGEEIKEGTPICVIKAHLPVYESFGFVSELRALTSGQAFPTMTFDHWELCPGDPMEAGSKLFNILEETRKRRKLKAGNPELGEYSINCRTVPPWAQCNAHSEKCVALFPIVASAIQSYRYSGTVPFVQLMTHVLFKK